MLVAVAVVVVVTVRDPKFNFNFSLARGAATVATGSAFPTSLDCTAAAVFPSVAGLNDEDDDDGGESGAAAALPWLPP